MSTNQAVTQAVARQLLRGLRESLTIASQVRCPPEVVNKDGSGERALKVSVGVTRILPNQPDTIDLPVVRKVKLADVGEENSVLKNSPGTASEPLQAHGRLHFTAKTCSNLCVGTEAPSCSSRRHAFFNHPLFSACHQKIMVPDKDHCHQLSAPLFVSPVYRSPKNDGIRDTQWRPRFSNVPPSGAVSHYPSQNHRRCSSMH
jgi:hypothetical protein